MREDIFEGLKIAVSKGESLQQAMQSFYNSGYKKEEIEEAARALQMYQAGQPIPQTLSEQTTTKNQQAEVPIKQGMFQKLIQKIPGTKQTQETSQQPKLPEKDKPQKLAIILLGVVLFLLIVALVGVIIFKKDIVSFLTGKIIEMFS